MKQSIDLADKSIAEPVRNFVQVWKHKKGYSDQLTINVGECIELLIAVTYNLHYENSDGRFFNKILQNAESIIGWEGNEFIDILWFEASQAIKQRLSSGNFAQ